ncbi:MAG: hypothetical protein M1374_04375 [Firmicutes bacterium]|nr:hypothetical protein [Bacillota bacterium]
MSDNTENDFRRSGWIVEILAIPMLMCCGLPTIVAVPATASVLIKGVLTGVAVVVIGTVFVVLISRHIRHNLIVVFPLFMKYRHPSKRSWS